MRVSSFIYIIGFLLCVICPQAQSMNQLNADEILAKYEDTLSALQGPVVFKSKSEYFFEGDFPPGTFPERRILTGEHRRDGDRWDYIVVREGFESGDGKEPSEYFRRREIVTHHHMGYEIYNKGDDQPRFMSWETPKDRGYSHRRILSLSEYGSVLEGIMPNEDLNTIPDIIRGGSSLKLHEKMEMIDGHRTYVLEAETKYGRYTLWIDPEYGYNPRRIAVHRDIKEKLKPLEEGEYRNRPNSPQTAEDITVDQIKIEQVGDRFLPTEANFARYHTFANGQWTRIRLIEKRENFDFQPDFESIGAFKVDLPNGTKVYNEDFPAVKFIWVDGDIKPDIDDVTIDAMEQFAAQIFNDKSIDKFAEESRIPQSNKKVEATVAVDGKNSDIPHSMNNEQNKPIIGSSNRKSLSFIWLVGILIIIGLLAVSGYKYYFSSSKNVEYEQ